MSYHKKTHRMLLVIGFIYLTMCPHSYEVNSGFFDYSAVGNRITSIEQRTQRECHLNIPHAAVCYPAHNLFNTLESTCRFNPSYETLQNISLTPLSCVKLQL
jgi:hypothetical protein